VGDPVKTNYVPDEAALAQCRALGGQVAARMKQSAA
jgi:hypothetical protein